MSEKIKESGYHIIQCETYSRKKIEGSDINKCKHLSKKIMYIDCVFTDSNIEYVLCGSEVQFINCTFTRTRCILISKLNVHTTFTNCNFYGRENKTDFDVNRPILHNCYSDSKIDWVRPVRNLSLKKHLFFSRLQDVCSFFKFVDKRTLFLFTAIAVNMLLTSFLYFK